MEALVRPLKAVADESRLRILWILEDRPLCVCELQEALGLAQSTVSRHLQILEEAGFVVSEKDGPWRNYRLSPSPPPAVQALLSAVRLAAAAQEEAQALRGRVKEIRRHNSSSRSAA